MKTTQMSDAAIAGMVGHKLKMLRLQQNLKQAYVAEQAGMSRPTLTQLERGIGTVVNAIAVARALGALDMFSTLISELRPSPIAIAKMQGKQRQRGVNGYPQDTAKNAGQVAPRPKVDW